MQQPSSQVLPPPTGDRGRAATALSGKGGTAKSFMQFHLAGQASTEGISTILMDADPEQNLTNKFIENNPHLKDAAGLGDVLIAAGVLNGDDDFDIEAGAAKLIEVIQATSWDNVFFLTAGKPLQTLSQVSLTGDNWMWALRDIFEEAGLYHRFRLLLPDTAGRRGSLVTMIMYACDIAYSPIYMMEDAVKKAIQARDRVKAIQGAHPLHWAGVVLTGLDLRAAINEVIRSDAAEAFHAVIGKDGKFETWGEVIVEIPYRPATVHQAYQLGERLIDLGAEKVRPLMTLFHAILHDHILTAPSATEEPESTEAQA